MDRRQPFPEQARFLDWVMSNCDRCQKGSLNNDDRTICDLESALEVAILSDGTVAGDIAARLGVPEDTGTCWQCLEFVPAPPEQD
jgi:hypothetical protein